MLARTPPRPANIAVIVVLTARLVWEVTLLAAYDELLSERLTGGAEYELT